MFMSRRRTLIALCAAALSTVLLLPDVSSAQFRGFGGGGRMYGGGYGGWGNPYSSGAYGWSAPNYGGNPYYGTWDGNYVMPGNTYTNPQPYNYSSPIFNGTYYPGDMTVSNQSLYPPDGRSQMMMEQNRAYIDVRVPPNARVMFDDSPTQQQGPDRRFMTPPLEPNGQYTYKVTAQWMQNGKEHRESRVVRLTPGQSTQVNFLNSQNSDGVQQQRFEQQPRQDQDQQPTQTQRKTTVPDR